ncbi:MAG: hypothetical protein QOG48_1958 [Verrucomicrobiota bacterium]|jgi:hypothetical protein
MSENIFTLSKREQRAAIAIVLALLIGTLAVHLRSLRSEIRAPASSTAPPPQEEQANPEDSP